MSNKKASNANARPKSASPLLQEMMSKSGVVASATTTRREGYAIQLSPLDDGSPNSRRYGMDMREAPIPQRRYAADICSVHYMNGETRIVFAQQGFEEGDIDSALVIRMNSDASVNFANSLIDMGGIDEIEASLKFREEVRSRLGSKPAQSAIMMANICSAAIAGKETCLDFYHASAFAIRKAETETMIEVEPVVRVDLRSSMFIAFARKIIEIAAQIKKEENAV